MQKLIRDKIIEIIENEWRKVNYYICDEKEYKKRLFDKLFEEVKEVINSNNKNELKEEFADLLEVFYSVLKNENINFEEIEKIRKEKKGRKMMIW